MLKAGYLHAFAAYSHIGSLGISVTWPTTTSVAFFENDVYLTKSGVKGANLVGVT